MNTYENPDLERFDEGFTNWMPSIIFLLLIFFSFLLFFLKKIKIKKLQESPFGFLAFLPILHSFYNALRNQPGHL